MKVAATLNLDDDQLIAIGMAETGKFKRATAKEARAFMEAAAYESVLSITEVVTEARNRIADEIKAGLHD